MEMLNLFLVALLCILGPVFAQTTVSDALRFKEEYESLNGLPRSDTSCSLYHTTYIPTENQVHYIDASGAFDLLTAESAVIYFGANWCPWCRNIIPILLEETKKAGVESLFYVDITNERDTFCLQGEKAIKETAGTKGYYQILEVLDAYLLPYTLTSGSGKSIYTGEKRLLIPFLLVISKGSIRCAEVCIYQLEANQTKYDPMTDTQKAFLHLRFAEMLSDNT